MPACLHFNFPPYQPSILHRLISALSVHQPSAVLSLSTPAFRGKNTSSLLIFMSLMFLLVCLQCVAHFIQFTNHYQVEETRIGTKNESVAIRRNGLEGKCGSVRRWIRIKCIDERESQTCGKWVKPSVG